MIFLTSNGLSSPELTDEFRKAIENRGRKAAVIPTAMEKDKNKDEYIAETINELSAFGFDCDCFYLGVDENEKLLDYDLVYICGGNVFYLMQVIKQCDAQNVIEKVSKSAIIVGVSAGSLIMQKDLVLIKDLIPKMNKRVKLKDLTALNLTNGIEHLPHKTRYINTIDAFEKRVATYKRKTGNEVYCLEDGQGIIIDGEVTKFIM